MIEGRSVAATSDPAVEPPDFALIARSIEGLNVHDWGGEGKYRHVHLTLGFWHALAVAEALASLSRCFAEARRRDGGPFGHCRILLSEHGHAAVVAALRALSDPPLLPTDFVNRAWIGDPDLQPVSGAIPPRPAPTPAEAAP